MKIESELTQVEPDRDSVLTVGVFDGVHLGHRHLLSQVASRAREARHLAGVVTLRNHPASVLRPDFRPAYLTGLQERLRLIQEVGVDFVVPVTFDQELSKLRASDFSGLLHRQLRMKGLVVGPDFALGYKREGDANALTEIGRGMGFYVDVVEPLTEGDRPIRSTSVREALLAGDARRVADLLGRRFALEGTVVRGEGRGANLGFPTANLSLPDGMAMPADGIYATWALVGEQRHMAATSIGTRPTFGEGDRTVEAFILDFEGDLYGRELRLEFEQRLRDEVRYDSASSLREQMQIDVAQTKAILSDRTAGAGQR